VLAFPPAGPSACYLMLSVEAMSEISRARVIDSHHLELREPIQTPPGSSVTITVEPTQTAAEDPGSYDLTALGLQTAPAKVWPKSASIPFNEISSFRPSNEDQVSAQDKRGEIWPSIQSPVAPELCVFALGSARVFRGDTQITSSTWKYSKTRELFFFLLCHSPRTKEQIGIALWPEASPAQLGCDFRVALYHLRRALGRSEWICLESGRFTVNRALSYRFDVEEFEQQIAEGRRQIASEENALSAIQALRRATDLYRGDFLEGWNSGEWHCQRRQELEREYLVALLMLGQLYADRAQYLEAMDVYRRAIAADGYLEAARRELMRCYARMGEYAEAVRHYQELSRLLRNELGMLPSPQTQALCAQLLKGEAV